MAEDAENEIVTVVSSDGHRMSVSKSCLVSDSDYFTGLFNSGMKECLANEVHLPIIDRMGLQNVVTFMESGKCDVTMMNVEGALQAATYLQTSNLLKYVCEFLKSKTTPENCSYISSLAKEYYLSDLENYAKKYLFEHVKAFSVTEEFTKMQVDDFIELLDDDEVYTDDETEVFEMVMKWLMHDKMRLVDCRKAFDVIRFSLMETHQIQECKDMLKAVGVYDQCEIGLEETIFDQLSSDQGSRKRKMRCAVPVLVATGGFTGKEFSTNRLQILPIRMLETSPPKNKLLQFKGSNTEKLPVTLCEHGVCVMNNVLYVAGGQTLYCQDGRYTRNTVDRYDPVSRCWTEVSPMHTPRSLFYLGQLEGCMYAVGGWRAPDMVTRTVERYIPSADTWEDVASLEIGLHEHAGCNLDGVLFISGGFKGPYRGHLDKLWSYNPTSDQWAQRSHMIHSRSYHVMISHDAKLIVAGGVKYHSEDDSFEDVKDCETYDPGADQWTYLTQTLRFASCMPGVVVQKKLYLFGGHSFVDDTNHSMVQIFDLDTKQWQECEMSANKIQFFACCKLNVHKKMLRKLWKYSDL